MISQQTGGSTNGECGVERGSRCWAAAVGANADPLRQLPSCRARLVARAAQPPCVKRGVRSWHRNADSASRARSNAEECQRAPQPRGSRLLSMRRVTSSGGAPRSFANSGSRRRRHASSPPRPQTSVRPGPCWAAAAPRGWRSRSCCKGSGVSHCGTAVPELRSGLMSDFDSFAITRDVRQAEHSSGRASVARGRGGVSTARR
jgi:hypothetical protein